ncbi:MAG: hypothetical protein ACFFCD_17705 [Promethearchaeota archaeon]
MKEKDTNKAQAVRDYLKAHPRANNKSVVKALGNKEIIVTTDYVGVIRRRSKKKKRGTKGKQVEKTKASKAKYPRHSIEKVLRIPRAILEQNAGKECSEKDSAKFVGVGYAGPYQLEISSALKYGLLERPSTKRLKITPLAKRILRPQNPDEELKGLRESVLNAPDISDVYNHYRGENLPDIKFFKNALVDKFNIPDEKINEFISIFIETLEKAQLLEKHDDKYRVLDYLKETEIGTDNLEKLKKSGKKVSIGADDTCFVVMPFAEPHGSYYSKIYEPAIQKAGLKSIRADSEIFGAGKVMDQIWSGINAAKILVAELTTKNPNVFYELGIAHALRKPVVLVSSNEGDVPFDLHHIRVIYYDVNDPFWGEKLMEKVAENILSAIENPEEAIFKGESEG